MAELMIISETGMFHSACRCTYQGAASRRPEWYGFVPSRHRQPVGDGKVDRSDRSHLINHYITFEIQDALLRRAMARVVAEYQTKTYALGVTDCVSFSADVARQCQLYVPAWNITPYGFIQVLRWWNRYLEFE